MLNPRDKKNVSFDGDTSQYAACRILPSSNPGIDRIVNSNEQ